MSNKAPIFTAEIKEKLRVVINWIKNEKSVTPEGQSNEKTDALKTVEKPAAPKVKKIEPLGWEPRKVRKTPKGTTLVKFERDEAIMTFKATLKFWWPAPYILAGVALFFVPIFGVTAGTTTSHYLRNGRFIEASFSWWPLIFLSVLSIAVVIIAWLKCYPNVRVVIQKDRVLIGSHLFDRHKSNGFRKGYEDNGPNDNSGNFLDKTFTMSTTLRFQYGNWGDDLEYMINSYHASEIVIWMNAIMAEVGKEEPKATDPEKGQRQQVF